MPLGSVMIVKLALFGVRIVMLGMIAWNQVLPERADKEHNRAAGSPEQTDGTDSRTL